MSIFYNKWLLNMKRKVFFVVLMTFKRGKVSDSPTASSALGLNR